MALPVDSAASYLAVMEFACGMHFIGETPLNAEDSFRMINANAWVVTGCLLSPGKWGATGVVLSILLSASLAGTTLFRQSTSILDGPAPAALVFAEVAAVEVHLD